MLVDLLVGILFLLGLYYFGTFQKVQNGSTYLLAGRKTKVFALTATLVMTEFNTATLISFSSLGYLAGARALSLPLVFLIGLLFYAFSVARKWKGFNGVSVAGYFSKRYGRDVGVLASIALLLAMAGFSATYVKSLYLLLAPFFPGLGPWTMSGMLVLSVFLLMFRGGLISIIRTDIFSFLVCLCFFPLMAFFSYTGAPVESEVVLPPRFIVSLIVLTMFTYILAPWYGQKIFAAQSKKTAFLSVFFSAVIVFALYGLAVLSCSWLKNEISDSQQALPMVLLALPSGLKGLGFGLLFAASATTLNGVWSAMSTLFVGDFFSKNQGVKSLKGLTALCATSSFVLANILVDRVLDKLILANIPVAALSFALLAGFYWEKASRFGVYLSMIVGWGAGIGSYLYFGEAGGYTWYWAMGGIPAIFISGVIGSLLVPNNKLAFNSYYNKIDANQEEL